MSIEKNRDAVPLNDIFDQGMNSFVVQAERELRMQGFDDSDVASFSETYRRRFKREYELLSRFKKVPIDLHEHVDDTLRLTISDLKEGALKDAVNGLWGLRAEEQLDRIQLKNANQSEDNVINFKKSE